MNRATLWLVSSALALTSVASRAQTSAAFNPAAAFGAQEATVSRLELSPDGKHIVYVGPGPGTTNIAYVVDIAAGKQTAIFSSNGQPLRLAGCGWVSPVRLVCRLTALVMMVRDKVQMAHFSRLFALDLDGKNVITLGQRDTDTQLYYRQFDGTVLDWLAGKDGTVLMTRYYVPEMSTGTLTAHTDEGYGVDLVDTRTQKSTMVERPKLNVQYWSDGRGVVRMMERDWVGRDELLNGKSTFYYRATADADWRELGTDDTDHQGIEPLAVDSGANAAYVLKYLDGRRALYRIALDGSLKSELVFAHPQVDVQGVVTIGRNGRVIGASYVTDKPQVEYFDPTYKGLKAALARALPDLPLIGFVSADATEQILLIYAGSDNDPGHYYLFNRGNHHLDDLMLERPQLARIKLSQVKPVVYPAVDGTSVPAYLTLPPGVDHAAGLPAIVMPHGGPAARDVWGFDWLAQYYANRGFAVLQPNFRGSAGYGTDWFVRNGFQNWKIAVGDIIDGGRWLVSQGIADPGKLAIMGWSYGGYAALQANVVAPDLFKAVVAVAPVTDLGLLKNQYEGFTNELTARDYIGSGPHIDEGSPARHAAAFKAPVLLIHGEKDATVDVQESKLMDSALKRAGKHSELITYPDLDHQLLDNAARADMLQRSYDFLAEHTR